MLWPGGATSAEFGLLLGFVSSDDLSEYGQYLQRSLTTQLTRLQLAKLDLGALCPDTPIFSACAMAYIVGAHFCPDLARLVLRALFKHCDSILMDAFHNNTLFPEADDNPDF